MFIVKKQQKFTAVHHVTHDWSSVYKGSGTPLAHVLVSEENHRTHGAKPCVFPSLAFKSLFSPLKPPCIFLQGLPSSGLLHHLFSFIKISPLPSTSSLLFLSFILIISSPAHSNYLRSYRHTKSLGLVCFHTFC